jgi:heme-based aerotactic transducer
MTIEMGNEQLSTQLRMINLTKEDLRMIRSIQPVMIESIDEIIEIFYETILKVAALRQIITDHSTIDRLRTTLKQHIIELFSGHLDNEYVLKRLRIAVVHQRIGLEPKWYIGSFQNLQNTFRTSFTAPFPTVG